MLHILQQELERFDGERDLGVLYRGCVSDLLSNPSNERNERTISRL